MLQQIKKQQYRQLHIVLGFVNDKDVKGVLQMFPKEAKYYFVKPNITRGMDMEELASLALQQGLKGMAYKTVKKGLKAAMASAETEDMVYVGGSTFVVAEVV